MTDESQKVWVRDDAGNYLITNEDAATICEALKLLKKKVGKNNDIFGFAEERLGEIKHLRKIFKEGKDKFNESWM